MVEGIPPGQCLPSIVNVILIQEGKKELEVGGKAVYQLAGAEFN